MSVPECTLISTWVDLRHGYDRAVAFVKLKKLFRLRRATPAETKSPERSPEQLGRDVDLLEQVAAGIALNKTPGR